MLTEFFIATPFSLGYFKSRNRVFTVLSLIGRKFQGFIHVFDIDLFNRTTVLSAIGLL